MRDSIMIVAACLATPAALADGERLYFEISNDLSPSQPTAVVTLWTEFDPADYCFGATHTGVHASDGLWSDPMLEPLMMAAGTDPGTVSPDGLSVEDVIPGQFHWPRHGYGDPSNPIALWHAEITVTDFTARDIELSTLTARYIVYPEREGLVGRSAIDDLTEASAMVIVVPAPGVVVGFGMLLMIPSGRRR